VWYLVFQAQGLAVPVGDGAGDGDCGHRGQCRPKPKARKGCGGLVDDAQFPRPGRAGDFDTSGCCLQLRQQFAGLGEPAAAGEGDAAVAQVLASDRDPVDVGLAHARLELGGRGRGQLLGLGQ